MTSFFENNPSAVVSSNRILYTPSDFAKTTLLHLQEIGMLKALKEHTSQRDHLQSYLFFLVLSGSGELYYEGNQYSLSEGTCVFIDCRQQYSHTTSTNLWSICWCHFNGSTLPSIYEKYLERGGKPVFAPKTSEPFIIILDRLQKIAGSGDYIRDMEINEELNRLCTLLMAESWHPEEANSHASKKKSILPVRRYLERHYAEKVSLDQLSQEFFINKFYLTRVFKKQFGYSITACLQNIRITHAKQMLRFSDKSIEEIALICGFGQLHYFSRVFKSVEGVAPSVYRNQW